MYDYLVVGSGLYGATFAQQAKAHGKSVLVIDKRPNIAGNVYTEKVEGINFHKYGAHIFHTNNREVWEYLQQFTVFNRFTNSPVANYKGELYSMPFNMYTFNKMWGVVTPEEAQAKIDEQRKEITGEPQNLEEQAISLVGRDIYEKLVKGYTEKQWGRDCKELPAFIIKRLPVRLIFDNNYFNAPTKSDGTVPRSPAEVIGSNTFFAPLSKHTCRVLANSSTLIRVPPILISPKIARLLSGVFPSAAEQITISVGNARFPVIPMPCIS